jgi:hypothetical protein
MPAARAIEAELEQVWDRYDSAMGEPPSDELMHEALRRRARANENLSVAIELMMEEKQIEGYRPNAGGSGRSSGRHRRCDGQRQHLA